MKKALLVAGILSAMGIGSRAYAAFIRPNSMICMIDVSIPMMPVTYCQGGFEIIE